MNRKDWRERACEEVNWDLADADESVVDEISAAQNVILSTVHLKCPAAFVPDTETVFVYKDQTDATFGSTCAATADVRTLSLGTCPDGEPKTDGTWDGLFHIEVKDSDGRWHRRQCREFWTTGGVFYVSIDRPWRNTTDTGMSFRLHQPYLVTRADVTEVLDAQVYDATRTFLQSLPEGWVHWTDRNDFQGRSKGRPSNLYRSKRVQIEAPNIAPLVAIATGDPNPPWVGPEPTGTFTYLFTYVWGRRDNELVAPSGILDPTFESAPSPPSAAITAPSDGSRAIDLTLPEIDWQLNFNLTGVLSAARSGYRKRIYRARQAVTGGGSFKTTIEYPDVYQLLDEVDGATTTYRDNGTDIPDYHRRLPESHGYYMWRVYPQQDDEYQIDMRVRRKPTPLYNDYDAPNVDPTANEMLIEALKAKLYARKGKPAEAAEAQQKFESMMREFQGRFAAPAKIIPPTPWGSSGFGPVTRRPWLGQFTDS